MEYDVVFKLDFASLKQAMNAKRNQLIAISRRPDVQAAIAYKAMQLIRPYVPANTGTLRDSATIAQHARGTTIRWSATRGPSAHSGPFNYADIQYTNTDYTHSGMQMANWTKVVQRGGVKFEDFRAYAESVMKKEARSSG